jgi:hypothetical protein
VFHPVKVAAGGIDEGFDAEFGEDGGEDLAEEGGLLGSEPVPEREAVPFQIFFW